MKRETTLIFIVLAGAFIFQPVGDILHAEQGDVPDWKCEGEVTCLNQDGGCLKQKDSNGTRDAFFQANDQSTWGDYTFSVDICLPSSPSVCTNFSEPIDGSSDHRYVGVYFRVYHGSEHYGDPFREYLWDMRVGAAGDPNEYKNHLVKGSYSIAFNKPALIWGDCHTAQVEAKGTEFFLSLDNYPVGSFDSGEYTVPYGGVGLRTRNTCAEFDALTIDHFRSRGSRY